MKKILALFSFTLLLLGFVACQPAKVVVVQRPPQRVLVVHPRPRPVPVRTAPRPVIRHPRPHPHLVVIHH